MTGLLRWAYSWLAWHAVISLLNCIIHFRTRLWDITPPIGELLVAVYLAAIAAQPRRLDLRGASAITRARAFLAGGWCTLTGHRANLFQMTRIGPNGEAGPTVNYTVCGGCLARIGD